MNFFTEHPASVGETWDGHARFALRCARLLAWAALAATVHAVIPALFQTTASRTMDRLWVMFHERLDNSLTID
tara:strand:- start:364 stop:582 length:219 start_codon:yes stop_codon:yes gene_type:complete